MRLFAYKISRDYGFAPNPFHGTCTLGTCKPNIRSQADKGDLVVGCGSSENHLEGRVIYVLRVTGKFTFQQYWEDPRFSRKRPIFKSSRKWAHGDNIYHRDADGEWVQERSGAVQQAMWERKVVNFRTSGTPLGGGIYATAVAISGG